MFGFVQDALGESYKDSSPNAPLSKGRIKPHGHVGLGHRSAIGIGFGMPRMRSRSGGPFEGNFIARLLIVPIIGFDDGFHQSMANDILVGKVRKLNAFDAHEDFSNLGKA